LIAVTVSGTAANRALILRRLGNSSQLNPKEMRRIIREIFIYSIQPLADTIPRGDPKHVRAKSSRFQVQVSTNGLEG